MKSLKKHQRGISMVGFIFGAFALIIVAVFGMKLVPSYLHSSQIGEIFHEIANDPAMREASEREIMESFRKRASVNDINDLQPEDIVIDRDGGNLRLSASYSIKVHLAGNVTLLLEFNPSSS